jgi:hypothetical protein
MIVKQSFAFEMRVSMMFSSCERQKKGNVKRDVVIEKEIEGKM